MKLAKVLGAAMLLLLPQMGEAASAGEPRAPRYQSSYIRSSDGLGLYLQTDLPHEGAPRAVLVISHGLASHSGVFAPMAARLAGQGIATYRFDHRAHGRSAGRDSLHIQSYWEMVDDLELVVELARRAHPSAPIFVLGHSMGGHIAALMGTRRPGLVQGYVLAAGVLRYHQMNFGYLPRPEPADSFIGSTQAAHMTLNLPMAESGSDLSLPNDPLILERISVSFPNSFKEGIKYLRDYDHQWTDPVLLLSGDADLYVVPQDAIDFYRETNSTDKSLRLYSGLGHLLFLEPGGDEVTTDIIHWIRRRSPRP